MEKQLRAALSEAMNQEFDSVPDVDDLNHLYTFSDHFQAEMRRISRLAERNYVSVGRHRIRRAAAMALIAAMILAAAAGAAAIRRPIVQWFTQNNEAEGSLDVSFEVDDPDGLTKQFTYVKPGVPEGYKIIYEDKVDGQQYSIIYQNEEGMEISYLQTGDIEGMGLGLDNETGDLQETEVNGYKGYSYSSKDNNSLIWSNGIYLFNIGGTCSMEVIREMAEKIN
ncbi:DUF4367 domain-containing protein [Emergencia sp.]|uniref:DUF4367 domain-containing protein n=1 Tax=Emergencia sp. TaxID=1926557 RepID=UPI003AEFB7A2